MCLVNRNWMFSRVSCEGTLKMTVLCEPRKTVFGPAMIHLPCSYSFVMYDKVCLERLSVWMPFIFPLLTIRSARVWGEREFKVCHVALRNEVDRKMLATWYACTQIPRVRRTPASSDGICVLRTVHCDRIVQYKPTKCTFSELIF
jgi:hypothetical protein